MWSRSDSNRRPLACKASALPAELRPQKRRPDCRGPLPSRCPARGRSINRYCRKTAKNMRRAWRRVPFLKTTLCDRREARALRKSPKGSTVASDRGSSPAKLPWSTSARLLLRKEVIQPQVPLRLPCYDFIPITSLTIGRCFPCGLAHALQAKPAFMM